MLSLGLFFFHRCQSRLFLPGTAEVAKRRFSSQLDVPDTLGILPNIIVAVNGKSVIFLLGRFDDQPIERFFAQLIGLVKNKINEAPGGTYGRSR